MSIKAIVTVEIRSGLQQENAKTRRVYLFGLLGMREKVTLRMTEEDENNKNWFGNLNSPTFFGKTFRAAHHLRLPLHLLVHVFPLVACFRLSLTAGVLKGMQWWRRSILFALLLQSGFLILMEKNNLFLSFLSVYPVFSPLKLDKHLLRSAPLILLFTNEQFNFQFFAVKSQILSYLRYCNVHKNGH